MFDPQYWKLHNVFFFIMERNIHVNCAIVEKKNLCNVGHNNKVRWFFVTTYLVIDNKCDVQQQIIHC